MSASVAADRGADEARDLAVARYGTRFVDPDTERRYARYQLASSAPFLRTGVLSSAVLWVLFGALLWAVGVVRAWDGWGTWLFGVMIPSTLIGAWIAGRRDWLAAMPFVSALLNTLAGATVVVLLAGRFGWIDAAATGASVVSYYGFAIFRMRPALASLAVAPYLLMQLRYAVDSWSRGAWDTAHFATHAFALGTVFCTGLMINVVLDVVTRQAFAQSEIIERQRATIARERARSEALLAQELSHQVAARSRELGQMLSRVSATVVAERPRVGARFDTRYSILRELGAGGMGAVYEVERITDGARLALKIVTGEVTGSQAARFAREAEIGARVRHPNVVPIVDVGIVQGVPFLAMELAPDGALEAHRARFGEAAWAEGVLAQVARGIAALHREGIVHRDLKPANVLFARVDGALVAKISDFGISRFGALEAAGAARASADPRADTLAPDVAETLAAPAKRPGLTATGALIGTPMYMAPEAVRGGQAVEAPADVFAFGLLACEVSSGHAAFKTPAVFSALAGDALAEPDLDGVPDALRDLVRACLAELPAARPTMDAVASQLGR